MIHDFATSLRASQAEANAPWWEEIYREAFPDFATMNYVGNCPAQRDGIDRVIVTTNAHIYYVDEKVRVRDYDDFCLEYWSEEPTAERSGKPGWVAKDLACDFVAYVFVPSRRCYLLPFPLLRRSCTINGPDWIRLGEAGHDGFRIIRAQNSGWVTVSVGVPIDQVLDSLKGAVSIRWGNRIASVQSEGR